ncbi:MAG: DUF6715 family protein [Lachnospiraceae bacterium]
MGKILKKNLRIIIAVAILAVLGISYYFYLANRPQGTPDIESDNPELSRLLTLDVANNYPQTPKEVVKLYAQITQAYYKTKLTDQQIEVLGMKARLLFDDELLKTQTDSEFLIALKNDIDTYQGLGRFVGDFEIASSSLIQYKTIREKNYAIVPMKYILRQGKETVSAYHSFKLRKDQDGKWKILYWETCDEVELK